MNPLFYFDCNASYGPYPRKHPQARWSLDHLLEDLELAQIAGALVVHNLALHYDPMLANLRLVEEISKLRERLFPCWVALPALSGDFPPVQDFVKQMADNDVRAVRLEPVSFNLPIKARVWGDLAEALLQRQVLVVTSLEGFGQSFDLADQFLDLFREHPVLLMNHRWTHWRRLHCLMEEHPNLHTEFSAFQANRAVEYYAGRFGAGRCLFGTHLPFKAPGAARGFLDWTLLDEQEAQQVAGGNLRRLLGGAGPTRQAPASRWSDRLTDAAHHGRPVPCLVMDAHCHILHDGGHNAGRELVMVRGDADGMIELTRKAGIDQTAIMSWAGPLDMDSDLGNSIVENAVRRYPREFIGLATINPEFDDPDKIERIIQRYHRELRFPGLKTLCSSQTINYDDPLFARWYAFANEHHLYAVVDPGGQRIDEPIDNLARRYPNLGIHLDHCGQSWPYAQWAVKMALRHANIWAQLNYTEVTNGTVEHMVEHLGPQRVLFGTDSPMRDPRPQLDWVLHTRLSEADKRLVLGENFQRILQNVKWD